MIKKMNIKSYIQKYSKNKLVKGSLSFFIIKITAMAFGYLNIIIITKYFGTSALGIFSYIVSILTLIGTFVGLGVDQATTLRFISKFKAKKNFGAIKSFYFQAIKIIFFPGVLLSLLFFFFPEFIANTFFGKPENSFYIKMFAFLLIPISIRKINGQFLRAYKKIGQFGFVSLYFTPITVIILIGILIFSNNRSESVPITVHFISIFLLFILSFILVLFLKNWKYAKITQKVEIKKIFKLSLSVFFIGIAVTISKQADKLILGHFVTNSEIGIYHLMYRTAILVSIILLTANSSLSPKFSELIELNRIDELRNLISKACKYITLFSFVIFIFIIIFAKYIILFYGINYNTGVYILYVLASAQMFSAWVGPVGGFLLMSGNEKVIRNVSVVFVFLFVVLNIIFVYFYGIKGAATVVAVLIVLKNFIFLVYVKKKYNILFLYIPKSIKKRLNIK